MRINEFGIEIYEESDILTEDNLALIDDDKKGEWIDFVKRDVSSKFSCGLVAAKTMELINIVANASDDVYKYDFYFNPCQELVKFASNEFAEHYIVEAEKYCKKCRDAYRAIEAPLLGSNGGITRNTLNASYVDKDKKDEFIKQLRTTNNSSTMLEYIKCVKNGKFNKADSIEKFAGRGYFIEFVTKFSKECRDYLDERGRKNQPQPGDND